MFEIVHPCRLSKIGDLRTTFIDLFSWNGICFTVVFVIVYALSTHYRPELLLPSLRSNPNMYPRVLFYVPCTC